MAWRLSDQPPIRQIDQQCNISRFRSMMSTQRGNAAAKASVKLDRSIVHVLVVSDRYAQPATASYLYAPHAVHTLGMRSMRLKRQHMHLADEIGQDIHQLSRRRLSDQTTVKPNCFKGLQNRIATDVMCECMRIHVKSSDCLSWRMRPDRHTRQAAIGLALRLTCVSAGRMCAFVHE